jgi:Tol biopolymer transport system component
MMYRAFVLISIVALFGPLSTSAAPRHRTGGDPAVLPRAIDGTADCGPTESCEAGPRIRAAPGDLPTTGQLAFGVRRGGHWDIYAYDFVGGKTKRLTNQPNSDEWAPAYSHSGDRLAFLSDAADGSNQVWMMAPDGDSPYQVTDYRGTGAIQHVAWSGDDKQLLVSLAADPNRPNEQLSLNAVSAGGRKEAVLTNVLPSSSGWATAARNGNVVYVDSSNGQVDLLLSDPTWKTIGTVAATDDKEDVPSFSPDGEWVAFQVGERGSRHLEIARPDGSERQVILGPEGDSSDPVWSPDRRWIAYVGTVSGLWIVLVDGGQPIQLSPMVEPDYEAMWFLSWREAPRVTPRR